MVWNESLIFLDDQTALAAHWETAQGMQWCSSKRHMQGKQSGTGTTYRYYVAAGSDLKRSVQTSAPIQRARIQCPLYMAVQVAFGSFDRALCRILTNKELQQELQSTLHWQSTGCIICSTCTHMHSPRSRTKDSPLDNFEEAKQILLLLGKRIILCFLALNSHLRETLT